MSKADTKSRVAKYRAKQEAEGKKQIALWVNEKDVETIRLLVNQPHALAKLREQLRSEITAELRKKLTAEIEKKVRAKLAREAERAIKVQERAQYKRAQETGRNSPPPFIRFKVKPPAGVRDHLKQNGWIYNPVLALWITPKDPSLWPAIEKTLTLLKPYDVEAVELTTDAL